MKLGRIPVAQESKLMSAEAQRFFLSLAAGGESMQDQISVGNCRELGRRLAQVRYRERVPLGVQDQSYATVYPLTMVLRILSAQLLVLL
jgi:hypothetical protein